MLDILTAASKPIRIGNHEYRVGPLKLKELGMLVRWIRDHGERPLVRLKRELEYAPPEEHRQLIYEAWIEERDDWPPSPLDPKGSRVLFGDTPGQRYFLSVFLGKHQEVTDQELDFLMGNLDLADLSAMVMIAYGSDDLDPEAVWAAARRANTPSSPVFASQPPDGNSGGRPGTTGNGESSSSTSTASLPT